MTLNGVMTADARNLCDSWASCRMFFGVFVRCVALIDDRGHEPLTELLRQLGGWPVLDADWDETGFDLETSVAKLRLFGSRALVNMWVGVDDRHSDVHIIAVRLTFSRKYKLEILSLIHI